MQTISDGKTRLTLILVFFLKTQDNEGASSYIWVNIVFAILGFIISWPTLFHRGRSYVSLESTDVCNASHIPMTSQLQLGPLPLNVLIRLWGCCECSTVHSGARFRTMGSPTLVPTPSSEVGSLSAASFPMLWLLFPEVK